MCMLIFRPSGLETDIPSAWLDHFWLRNSDGFGAFWIGSGGVMEIRRTLDKDEARQIVEWIVAHKLQAGLHWRHATSGAKNMGNVHPFSISVHKEKPKLVLAHNGVMSEWQAFAADKSDSDTRGWVKQIVVPLVDKFGVGAVYKNNSPVMTMLLSTLGSNNRVLFGHPTLGWSQYGNWEGKKFRGMDTANNYAWNSSNSDKDTPDTPPWEHSYQNYKYKALSEAQKSMEIAGGPFTIGQRYLTRGMRGIAIITEVQNDNTPRSYPVSGIVVSHEGKVIQKTTWTAQGWFSAPWDKSGAVPNIYDLVMKPIPDNFFPNAQIAATDKPKADVIAAICQMEGSPCTPMCASCQPDWAKLGISPNGGEVGQNAAARPISEGASGTMASGTVPMNGKPNSGNSTPMVDGTANDNTKKKSGTKSQPTGSGTSRQSWFDQDDEPIVGTITLDDLMALPDYQLAEWCENEPDDAATAIKIIGLLLKYPYE